MLYFLAINSVHINTYVHRYKISWKYTYFRIQKFILEKQYGVYQFGVTAQVGLNQHLIQIFTVYGKHKVYEIQTSVSISSNFGELNKLGTKFGETLFSEYFRFWNYRWGIVPCMVMNLPGNAGKEGCVGSIPGSGRSPGGGNGNPLQYSCLDNPIIRGSWQATIHGVTKSRTWLKTHIERG